MLPEKPDQVREQAAVECLAILEGKDDAGRVLRLEGIQGFEVVVEILAALCLERSESARQTEAGHHHQPGLTSRPTASSGSSSPSASTTVASRMIFFSTAFRLGASADRMRTNLPWQTSCSFSDSCSNRRSWEATVGPAMMNAAGILVLPWVRQPALSPPRPVRRFSGDRT